MVPRIFDRHNARVYTNSACRGGGMFFSPWALSGKPNKMELYYIPSSLKFVKLNPGTFSSVIVQIEFNNICVAVR